MTILEFFNEYNIEHLRAYDHLRKTGQWPDGFINDLDESIHFWQVELMAKMSDAYIKLALAGKIEGFPPIS